MHLTDRLAPGRLLSLFVLLAVLPLVAMGWLGSRMLQQERELERQRRSDRLQNRANELADRLSEIPARAGDTELPPGVAWILFDSRGVVSHRGAPLRHFPLTANVELTPPDVFTAAELSEVQDGNPTFAVQQYRELSRHPDESVRAAAVFRLGSALARQGQTAEALAAYDDLASFGATPVVGIAAALRARKSRADLFERLGDSDEASAERRTLATLLSDGRYTLDRITFDLYVEHLPALPRTVPNLTQTVANLWPKWRAQPAGRETWTSDGTAFASVWTPSPQGTVALVGFSPPDVAGNQDSALGQRNLLLTGVGLMTLVIVAAGYFMFRSLHRELNVARLQSDFVAQVSHEFRTPLTAMRHLIELLEDGSASPGRLPQYYQALGKEARRLHSMVESLLDFGRIESGRHVYTMEHVSLADVAARVVSERGSTRVRVHTSVGVPGVRADREALVLAVQNLLDNALKYSPEAAAVDVYVEARDGKVGISIEDGGGGMSLSEQRRIRRKFVRGSAARRMDVKGTGIGLAIVEQVVRAHGGRLDIQSEPNQGSRFTLWVPAVEHT